MGSFVEINVSFGLFEDTPKEIIDILHSMIDRTGQPAILPEHEFFKCERWESITCGGSTSSTMIFDTGTKNWKISIRGDLKKYDCEIEKFLDWIVPYIATCGFIGYTKGEEYGDPTLVYIDDGRVVFKGVEVYELDMPDWR